jgi:hypothetical protein
MTDDRLHDLLARTDEQIQAQIAAAQDRACAIGSASADLVQSVQHRSRQQRRRTSLGVLAVFLIIGGLTARSSRESLRRNGARVAEHGATESVDAPKDDVRPAPTTEGGARRQLRAEEVARLKAEIARLEAEADAAGRFVKLYQAAELRRQRLAAAEQLMNVPLLPPHAVADLEIDRAAATTVIAADAQANTFHRPSEAADTYRSVLVHFPDSQWATVARARLEEMERMN